MENEGYSDGARAGALFATLIFPLFALIAALLLTSSERNPDKRKQLRKWAWASGAFVVLQLLLVVAAVHSP